MGTEGSSWKFHESIGHGSFGIVFKVENTSRTFSALKIVLRPSTVEEEEKVLREYTVMKEMEHPNLVQILGCQHHNFSPSELEDILKTVAEDAVPKVLMAQLKIAERRGTNIAAICIEMELCGPTLRDWLNQNSGQELTHNLQVLQLRIIQDIVDGVRFLHRNAIIHRDLKPDNIMFSHTYDTNAFLLPVKVGDFSLARVLHTEESMSKTLTSRVGTMDYMAPEVFYSYYDYKSDIYSIGLIMFEIIQLTNARDRKILFGKIKEGKIGEIKRHPMLPTSDQLICRAIKREIGDRFSTIEDFNAELNAAKQYPFNYNQFGTGTVNGMNVLRSVVSEADLRNLQTSSTGIPEGGEIYDTRQRERDREMDRERREMERRRVEEAEKQRLLDEEFRRLAKERERIEAEKAELRRRKENMKMEEREKQRLIVQAEIEREKASLARKSKVKRTNLDDDYSRERGDQKMPTSSTGIPPSMFTIYGG